MDMMSGQTSILGGQPTSFGDVGGDKIEINEFNRTESIMRDFLYRGSNIDAYALKDQVWNYLVEKNIVNKEANKLGLGVSTEELMELQFGSNLSPVIAQRFMNQQTRQIDFEQLNAIKTQIQTNTIDENFKYFWAHQEKEVVKQRLQDKISNMASKAIYTPSWMVDAVNNDMNGTMKLAVVKVPYEDVDNSTVSLSDDDFKSYYSENSFRYKQDEETRKVEYISFNVAPTPADSASTRAQLSERIEAFRNAPNDSLFVESNFGVFNPTYLTTETLPSSISQRVLDNEVGSIIGPYVEGDAFVLTKLIDRIQMADSADTRHILISATDPASFVAAQTRIDSFRTAIENRSAKFEDLATRFSQDPGSKDKGGLYENVTPNQFVPEYTKVLFVTGQIGKLYTVRTSYGIHLVEVLSRDRNTTPRVKLANISQSIIPSEETQQAAYNKVYKVVQNNKDINALRAAVQNEPNVDIETSSAFKANEFSLGVLGGGQASRDIIRWAFGDDPKFSEPNVGQASPEVYSFQDQALFYNNKYVIATLSQVLPKGTPSWQDIRSDIEPYVINRKKADILKGKMATTDLSAIASSNRVKVDTVNNVRFAGSTPGVLSGENELIAQIGGLTANATSAPIAGNGGVYVVKMLNKNPASTANPMSIKSSVENSYKGRMASGLIQAVKKTVGVSDDRASFF